MPTYEFRCVNGHVFDQFHKMSEAPSSTPCPTCGAVAERAISGGAGLVFKGSGFYLTDYGKNAHRAGGPEAKGDAGESKPAAKSESGGSSSGGESSGSSAGGGGGTSSGGSTSSGSSGSGGSSGSSGGSSGGSGSSGSGASSGGSSGGAKGTQ